MSNRKYDLKIIMKVLAEIAIAIIYFREQSTTQFINFDYFVGNFKA